MKVFFSIAVIALALVSCNQNKKHDVRNEEVKEVVVTDMHNARNSLDYLGTYKGTLPCADCSGIETEITLKDGNNYERKTKYLGKNDDKVYEETGTFSWNETGSIIILDNVQDSPNKYFVGENTLRQYDLEGNPIEGDLADKYILKK